MINRKVITSSVKATYEKPLGKLADVLINDKDVPDEFFIPESQHQEWEDAKGAKKLPRKSKDGYEYKMWISSPKRFCME